MSIRSLVAITAPVGFRLRTHWRSALTLLALGVLAVGLLAPSRSLARSEPGVEPALSLPAIPSAGSALMWTDAARTASDTQRESLDKLLSLIAALAWIGFVVASVSIFSCHAAAARERALETGVRRAVGASVKQIVWSLCIETAVLAAIALLMGLALGAALLSIARQFWPGPVAIILAADPVIVVALAAVLGAAGLVSLRLASGRDLIDPPAQEIGLKVPAYQVAVSVALLMGAAALLAGPSGASTGTTDSSAAAEVFRIDSGSGTVAERAARYRELLRHTEGLPGVTRTSLTSAGAALGLGTTDGVVTDCGRCFFGMIQIRWPSFTALAHAVSADTFAAHGIQLAAGRAFVTADTAGAPRVAIVNRHLAARYFQQGEAIGRDIFLGPGWPKTPYRVVGIVEDQRSPAIGGAFQPRETLYLSILQHPPVHAELLVQHAGASPPQVTAHGGVKSVSRLGTLATIHAPQARAGRWLGSALGISAVLVLAMALIGTVATAGMWADSMAWEVALRRSVGATRRRMAVFVLVKTAAVGIMGGALGLFFFATVVAPALAASLPGISFTDVGLLVRAAGLPMSLALLAAALPGLRLLFRPPSWILR